VRVYIRFSLLYFSLVLIVIMTDYISVSEALNLVSPFKGDKKEVLAFISNVVIGFEVINADNSDVLYKFVLTRIRVVPRVARTHRNLENWEDLRVFLKKKTLIRSSVRWISMPHNCLGRNRAKMTVFQSGSRT